MESLSRQEKIKALTQITQSQGWSILKDHWGSLLTRKERVKAEAIRQDKSEFKVIQGFVDVINECLNSPEILIAGLKESEKEGE